MKATPGPTNDELIMVGSSPHDLHLNIESVNGPGWRIVLVVGPAKTTIGHFKTWFDADNARAELTDVLQMEFNQAPAWCEACDGYVHEGCACEPCAKCGEVCVSEDNHAAVEDHGDYIAYVCSDCFSPPCRECGTECDLNEHDGEGYHDGEGWCCGHGDCPTNPSGSSEVSA